MSLASAYGADSGGMVVTPTTTLPAAEATRRGRRTAVRYLLVSDTTAITGALLAAEALLGRTASAELRSFVYVPVFIAVFAAYGLYRRGRRRLVGSSFPDLAHIAHALILASLIVALSTAALHRDAGLPLVSHTALLVGGLLAAGAVPGARMLARRIGGTRVGPTRVLVVGSGIIADRVTERMKASRDLAVIGSVDDNVLHLGNMEEQPLLGGLAELPDLVAAHDIDRLVVAFSPVNEAQVADQLRSLADAVEISVVPRMFDILTVRSRVDEISGMPVMDVAPPSLGLAERFAKRVIDVVVSAVGLVVLAPALVAIALAIKLTSSGPVLFRQERAGRWGRPFRICKFRTMVCDAEAHRLEMSTVNEVDGPIFKVRKDPRVTRVGGFLRRTSLDELPQLLNVLRGDMSLVGPRPFVRAESEAISGWAAKRFEVRPGVTGLWQISGRSDLPYEDLCRLDYSYVASWSLWWDLRILWHTPGSVLRRVGAY
jgi:exopolysaccharide biosynthesis polyprenyl glycosylphosphotransferase